MTELLGVAPPLREAMLARNYHELTSVQKAMLAPKVNDSDALVSAQTGSGKTVAFGLAIADTLLAGRTRLSEADLPLALIVAPTRELALQIVREFEWLFAATGAEIASCVGGMDMRTERRRLAAGAHIVVGTPGRLRDHLQRNSLGTTNICAVVLDEADEMLDLGFRDDLEFILAATPDSRRTLLFSATVPRGIGSLAKKYQRNAMRISTAEEKQQHSDIEYRALTVAARDRENAIVNVLRFYDAQNALVFCATRATVNHITARFRNRGFSVVALSGELTQNERTHALQAMRDGRARVCIATDVAARGIDLPNLELVVHADLPTNSETLLHRSGRTGRAGRKGVSALIVPFNKRRSAERLLSGAKLNAVWDQPPSAEDVGKRDDERLLSHSALSEKPQKTQTGLVTQLLAKFTPEQIAAAFVSVVREGQSAPEELQDQTSPEPRKHRGREAFAKSVWFSLSVGRKQNAEPGWLLPMLCKAGDLSKPDIGAIRIQQSHTFVEIDAQSVDRFVTAIGPNDTLEKNVRVKRLETEPAMAKTEYRKGVDFKKSPSPKKRKDRSRSGPPNKSGGKSKKIKIKAGTKPNRHKTTKNASTRAS